MPPYDQFARRACPFSGLRLFHSDAGTARSAAANMAERLGFGPRSPFGRILSKDLQYQVMRPLLRSENAEFPVRALTPAFGPGNPGCLRNGRAGLSAKMHAASLPSGTHMETTYEHNHMISLFYRPYASELKALLYFTAELPGFPPFFSFFAAKSHKTGSSCWIRTSGLLNHNQAQRPGYANDNVNGRRRRDRTADFLLPRQAPYQAGPVSGKMVARGGFGPPKAEAGRFTVCYR